MKQEVNLYEYTKSVSEQSSTLIPKSQPLTEKRIDDWSHSKTSATQEAVLWGSWLHSWQYKAERAHLLINAQEIEIKVVWIHYVTFRTIDKFNTYYKSHPLTEKRIDDCFHCNHRQRTVLRGSWLLSAMSISRWNAYPHLHFQLMVVRVGGLVLHKSGTSLLTFRDLAIGKSPARTRSYFPASSRRSKSELRGPFNIHSQSTLQQM